jgi:hypothetical protein
LSEKGRKLLYRIDLIPNSKELTIILTIHHQGAGENVEALSVGHGACVCP